MRPTNRVAEFFGKWGSQSMSGRSRTSKGKDEEVSPFPEFEEVATDALVEIGLTDPIIATMIYSSPSAVGNYKRGKVPKRQSLQFDLFCGIIGVDANKARQGVIERTKGESLGPVLVMLHKMQGTDAFQIAAGSIRSAYKVHLSRSNR